MAQVLNSCKCVLDHGACKRACCLATCSWSYLFHFHPASVVSGTCAGVSILKKLVWPGCILGVLHKGHKPYKATENGSNQLLKHVVKSNSWFL